MYSEAKSIKDTGCAKKVTHLCNSFIESPYRIVDDPFVLGHAVLFWLYYYITTNHVDGIAGLAFIVLGMGWEATVGGMSICVDVWILLCIVSGCH